MLFLLLSLVLAPGFDAQAANPCAKISPYVQKQLHMTCLPVSHWESFSADQPHTSAFVVLKQQADLALQNLYTAPDARRSFIVEALRQTALRTQLPLIQYLQAEGASFVPYYIHNMIRVDNAPASLIEKLAQREDVSRIFGNPSFNISTMGQIRHLGDKEDEPSPDGIEKSIESTGAVRVWNELHVKGRGITVAGQDTGVQWDHPALIHQYRGNKNGRVDHNFNWMDSIKEGTNQNPCGFSLETPCDDDQHGTHTMGTMLGDDGAQNKIGMAPEANWIACRNMNAGMGSPGSYIDCFQFFLAPYPLHGDSIRDGDPKQSPNVMNNSWGCPADEGCKGDEMVEVLQRLKDAGIFVVASAGNDGHGCSTIADQPAQMSDTTFSVGAHDYRNNQIAFFSSRGPSHFDDKQGPDVTAPGVGIRSSIPGNAYVGGWDGTSMAGPHVVGLVALMWSANPKLIGNIDATADIIRKTAIPTVAADSCGGIPGTAIPNNTFGYGRIDAFHAVNEALKFE